MTPGIIAIIFTLQLTACATSGPIEHDRFYRLNPDVAIEPASTTSAATLQVRPLAARGLIAGRQILFRPSGNSPEVRRHVTDLWEAQPTDAIADALIAALRQARIVAHVVGRSGAIRADYTLGGTLHILEHRPLEGDDRVAAAFDLILSDSHNRHVLFAASYQDTEPMASATPEAMIAAFNRLIGRLVSEAVRDMAPQMGGPSSHLPD